MHPMCHIKTDNIELAASPESTARELRLREALPTVDTASHAMIDQLYQRLNIRTFARGRRLALRYRRAALRNKINRQIELEQQAAVYHAKKAKFIGPLTIAQINGHPF